MTLPDGRVRPTATLIYFLLPAGESSAWHRVASDELWLAHQGAVTLELGGTGPTPGTATTVAVDVVEPQALVAGRHLAAHPARAHRCPGQLPGLARLRLRATSSWHDTRP